MKRTFVPFIVFSIGIAFAIACAAKPAAAIGQWPDTKVLYFVGVGVCVAALIAWRWSISSGKINSIEDGSSTSADLFEKLHQCRDCARQIAGRFNELDSSSLCQAIDDLLINYMDPFVESRHVLIDHFGMSKGSDILLKTAFAERQFNRVWSASSDHCPGEARVSFEIALSAMDEIVDYVERLD
jgi:hypothetical protein